MSHQRPQTLILCKLAKDFFQLVHLFEVGILSQTNYKLVYFYLLFYFGKIINQKIITHIRSTVYYEVKNIKTRSTIIQEIYITLIEWPSWPPSSASSRCWQANENLYLSSCYHFTLSVAAIVEVVGGGGEWFEVGTIIPNLDLGCLDQGE